MIISCRITSESFTEKVGVVCRYKTAEEAAHVFDMQVLKLRGSRAKVNFPEEHGLPSSRKANKPGKVAKMALSQIQTASDTGNIAERSEEYPCATENDQSTNAAEPLVQVVSASIIGQVSSSSRDEKIQHGRKSNLICNGIPMAVSERPIYGTFQVGNANRAEHKRSDWAHKLSQHTAHCVPLCKTLSRSKALIRVPRSQGFYMNKNYESELPKKKSSIKRSRLANKKDETLLSQAREGTVHRTKRTKHQKK